MPRSAPPASRWTAGSCRTSSSYHAGQPFELTLVKDNIFGLPEGREDASGTGWVTILSDLAPGTHTIVARDETTDPGLGLQAAEMVATITVTD